MMHIVYMLQHIFCQTTNIERVKVSNNTVDIVRM